MTTAPKAPTGTHTFGPDRIPDLRQKRFIGELLERGPAPYLFESANSRSYFARLRTPAGEVETIWGVGLASALRDLPVNTNVRIDRDGSERVVVHKADASGRIAPIDAQRTAWKARPATPADWLELFASEQARERPASDWRERQAEGQALRDHAQMVLAQATEAERSGDKEAALEMIAEAARLEMAGTLRACSQRQLDALSRGAWQELAAEPVDEEERAAAQAQTILQLLEHLLRLLVKVLTLGRVDIGGPSLTPEQAERAAQSQAREALMDAVQQELTSRAETRIGLASSGQAHRPNTKEELEAQTEVARLRTGWEADWRANRAPHFDDVAHVESVLAGDAGTWSEVLPLTRIAQPVAVDLAAARAAATAAGQDLTESAEFDVIFAAAKTKGINLDADRQALEQIAHRKRAEAEADMAEQEEHDRER